MKLNEKTIAEKDEAAFTKWFIDMFWKVNGKYVLPTSEELAEIGKEAYRRIKN